MILTVNSDYFPKQHQPVYYLDELQMIKNGNYVLKIILSFLPAFNFTILFHSQEMNDSQMLGAHLKSLRFYLHLLPPSVTLLTQCSWHRYFTESFYSDLGSRLFSVSVI
jgi:hypothetical protein